MAVDSAKKLKAIQSSPSVVGAIVNRLRPLLGNARFGPQLPLQSLARQPGLLPRSAHAATMSTKLPTTTAPAHYQCTLRAVSVPGPDTDLCLFLSFDNARYIFGAGEGMQRTLLQKKVNLRGFDAIFVPDGGSKGRAGLPGFVMTVADHGMSNLNIVGPSDITHFLASLRGCLQRSELDVKTFEHSSGSATDGAYPIFHSPFLEVKSVALSPNTSGGSSPDAGPSDYARRIVRDMFRPWSPGSAARIDPSRLLPLQASEVTDTDLVYIVQAPVIRGKFDNAKATQLGVPNGPLRGKLVKGQSIEVDDPDNPGQKRTINAEDVVSESRQGPTMIVVSCSGRTLPTLLSSTAFDTYHQDTSGSSSKSQTEVAIVVHRVPTSVWQHPGYQAWLRAFGPNTQHLIADTSSTEDTVTFATSAWNTLKMSRLDEELFPLPFTIPSTPSNSPSEPNTAILLPNHSIKLHPAGPLELLPPADKDVAFPTIPEAIQNARQSVFQSQPEIEAECSRAREAVRADSRWSQSSSEVGDDIMVTTLGTGSALPSKHRNVSCTHLDVPGFGGVLLDCGEGTLGQLRRRYGMDGVDQIYRHLKVIFISHMHADHHLGLQSVLEDRFKRGITSPLCLIAPTPIAMSLSESRAWQHEVPRDALDNLIWIDNMYLQTAPLTTASPSSPRSRQDSPVEIEADEDIGIDQSSAFLSGTRAWPSLDIIGQGSFGVLHCRRATDRLMRELGLVGIRTPRMQHRGRAWGLVMEHSSGWKVSYSGDTMPCRSFVSAARNSTLMIHEATLEDDKPDIAAEKGHSTFSQAIDTGRAAAASHILLNHFSQRYPKLPKSKYKSNGVSKDEEPVVCVSFDLMSIRVRDMWRMQYYMDAMEMIFPPEEEDGDGTLNEVKADINATVDVNGQGRMNGPSAARERVDNRGLKGGDKKGGSTRSESRESRLSPSKRSSERSAFGVTKRPKE